MEQTVQFKNLSVTVKSNILKDGKLYFNDKDIRGEVEGTYKEITYGKSADTSPETFLIEIYNALLKKNIKPVKINLQGLTYSGQRMTNFDKQTNIIDD